MRVIYADAVFLLNAAIDYVLLLAAGKLCALPLRRWRMGLGAAWGGVYAVLAAVWPGLFALWTVKLLAGVVTVAIAYGLSRATPRALTAFFAVAAAFAGARYAAASLGGPRSGGENSLPVLLLSFALCYAAVALVFRHIGRRAERKLCSVTVTLGSRTAAFSALADSGNELVDPLTGFPVLVAEAAALAPLTDDPAALALEATAALERLGGRPFRLLPCTSVSAASTLLLCFRPDGVTVDGRRQDLLVAVSPHALSPDGEYQGVVQFT